MQLADHRDGPARPGRRHHIQADIRVAAQAHALGGRVGVWRHQLGEHIGTGIQHVAGDEGVVGADVILLRVGVGQLRAGLKEELAHGDVAR